MSDDAKKDLLDVEAEVKNELDQLMGELKDMEADVSKEAVSAEDLALLEAQVAEKAAEKTTEKVIEKTEPSVEAVEASVEVEAAAEPTPAPAPVSEKKTEPELKLIPGGASAIPQPAVSKLKPVIIEEDESVSNEPKDQSELDEFRGGTDDASLEDTIGALGEEEPAEGSLLSQIGGGGGSGGEENGSITMTMSGKMTLKLRYEQAGHEVEVMFTEDAFRVVLSDGAEFKVPVKKAAPKKLRRVA